VNADTRQAEERRWTRSSQEETSALQPVAQLSSAFNPSPRGSANGIKLRGISVIFPANPQRATSADLWSILIKLFIFHPDPENIIA